MPDALLLVGRLVVEIGVRRPASPADPALGDAGGRQVEVCPVGLAARERVAVAQGLVLVHVGLGVGMNEAVAERVEDARALDRLRASGIDDGPGLELQGSRYDAGVGPLVAGDAIGDGRALDALE